MLNQRASAKDVELFRNYKLIHCTVPLERIDTVLRIRKNVTTGIHIPRWLKIKLLTVKRRRPPKTALISPSNKKVPLKPPQVRHRKVFDDKAEDLENCADLTPEAMETLFTPETNLVETTGVSIWATEIDDSIPKTLYVTRDQLPDHLKHMMKSNHMWIDAPNSTNRRVKVQVVDPCQIRTASVAPSAQQNAAQSCPFDVIAPEANVDKPCAPKNKVKKENTFNSKFKNVILAQRFLANGKDSESNTESNSSVETHSVTDDDDVEGIENCVDPLTFGIHHDHQYLVTQKKVKTVFKKKKYTKDNRKDITKDNGAKDCGKYKVKKYKVVGQKPLQMRTTFVTIPDSFSFEKSTPVASNVGDTLGSQILTKLLTDPRKKVTTENSMSVQTESKPESAYSMPAKFKTVTDISGCIYLEKPIEELSLEQARRRIRILEYEVSHLNKQLKEAQFTINRQYVEIKELKECNQGSTFGEHFLAPIFTSE